MRRVKCVVLLVALLAVAPVLTGCGSLDNFDMDSLDIFGLNKKKKLPGERKELFPEGVPGVSQGIPPEYLKGNQPPPETALAPAAEPVPPNGKGAAPASKTANLAPAEAPKPKPKRKPKPRAVEHAPTQVTVQPKPKNGQSADQQQQQQLAPWPNTPPAQGQGQSSSTAPWPTSPAPGTCSR
jgi:hypothetical protein